MDYNYIILTAMFLLILLWVYNPFSFSNNLMGAIYTIFFVLFSANYLYFWIIEMRKLDYRFDEFLRDLLLFFCLMGLTVIPLVKKFLFKETTS